MSEMPTEAARKQRHLSALRPALKGRWLLSLIIAIMLLGAAIWDWSKPPPSQLSVRTYNRMVVGGYRRFVRPATRYVTRCRFQPSCSAYSEKAMQTHGFAKGLCLTLGRLFRCMPWVPLGTHDPVPH